MRQAPRVQALTVGESAALRRPRRAGYGVTRAHGPVAPADAGTSFQHGDLQLGLLQRPGRPHPRHAGTGNDSALDDAGHALLRALSRASHPTPLCAANAGCPQQ